MQVFSESGAVTFLSSQGNSVGIPVNGIEGGLIPLVPATYPVDQWLLSSGLLELLFQMVRYVPFGRCDQAVGRQSE